MPGRGDPSGHRERPGEVAGAQLDLLSQWPNITRKKDSPADADEHKGEEGKYDKYFTPDRGEGD